MRTLIKIVIAVTLALSVVTASYAAGFGTHWWLNKDNNPTAEEIDHFTVFWETWHILERDFYGQLPTAQQMTYAAIRGILTTLDDPYTAFVEPKPRQLEKDDLRGSFGGIGAWVTKREEDGAIVLKPMEDKPAQRAGILEGDVVIQVDDQEISPDMSLEDVILLIRGPIGTMVKLTISRTGHPEPLVFEITRDKVETPTVTWRILDEGERLGYVSISLFTERTNQELETALKELKAQEITHLILDLRNNSGGLLETSIDVASQFLSDGMVLYEQRRDQEEKSYPVRRGGKATDVPLAVLVNAGTASASEIVAGAIQDSGRGALIGEDTFGKGSVQLVYDLSDQSSLHVTVAHWLTPNRHEITGNGLTPDIVVPLTEEDRAQGKDPQLERAIAYFNTNRSSTN
jgi:carboxyl-terminal processing protease